MAIITSVLTGGDNLHETTSEEVNAVATDFVSEGVVGAITNTSDVAPMTGAYAVNAQGTPDMTVAVTAGVAYVTATPTGQSSQALRVKLTANENVTISANSSGSTKYDWIYIDVDADAAADPAVGADDVSDLVTSRSSSSSTDDGTPPTYGTLIAVVTVSNGASSITNGNISDRRVRTGAKPAEGDVGTDQLADDAVIPAKLDSDAIGHGFLEIGRTTLGSAGDTIDVASLPTRKYLFVLVYLVATGGTVGGAFTFNGDSTGSNYNRRFSINGGADSTTNDVPFVQPATAAENIAASFHVLNVATKQKIIYAGLATSTAPSRIEFVGEWTNTSDAISQITFTNGGTGSYDAGSEVVVFGKD